MSDMKIFFSKTLLFRRRIQDIDGGWHKQAKPKGLSKIYEINIPKKLPDKISTPKKYQQRYHPLPNKRNVTPPKICLNILPCKKYLNNF
jgi:hypothetical protein